MKRSKKKEFARICMKRKNLPFTICHPFLAFLLAAFNHARHLCFSIFYILIHRLILYSLPSNDFLISLDFFPLFVRLFVDHGNENLMRYRCVRREMLLKDENKKKSRFLKSIMRFGVVFSKWFFYPLYAMVFGSFFIRKWNWILCMHIHIWIR